MEQHDTIGEGDEGQRRKIGTDEARLKQKKNNQGKWRRISMEKMLCGKLVHLRFTHRGNLLMIFANVLQK
ncbi:hypothetical protein M5689_000211 [Euphorbia peplus]|nr:hypothetical protein M5689_000211 [Euphorbia peplus]